ncbi:MAG TPA: glycosyltransferase [Candidatus Omnitrophota bacterium]|nr:glycosyltransferase [Candidatus Omnitrophota bacterium]HPD84080.1 glycosyltransferase [Candidatus Omnitrophota bacterium]HRZ02937.1 glycosyltransferase [Candidatus Omnitrophota bacterium]
MFDWEKHYDDLAPKRDEFRRRYWYYYHQLESYYRFFIPEGRRVLEVGCSTGALLSALKPSYGVGVDISGGSIDIARRNFPQATFHHGGIETVPDGEVFDYIVLSGLLGELDDVQSFLCKLRRVCTRDTRIVIEYHSLFWQYILRTAKRLAFKKPEGMRNWLTYQDIENFLRLAGFEPVKSDRHTLLPLYIPLISTLINRFIARLPFINALTFNHFIVARPVFGAREELSVTILVPCRNEKGNIEQAVTRTPVFGQHQEFIFVEGWSKDGTYEEVERIIKAYPKKDIKLYKQPGKGKGDAVHFGFEKAGGDVLMILDADLTVSPEDMPKFYQAIQQDKGEFINGCRLVYPMEDDAMRFLNHVANKFFGIFFSWLLGQRYKDTLCGTKVILRNHYRELVANRSYFGDFDPFGDFDLIFGANKLGLKMLEVPIRYKSRTYGETQIQRFRHGLLLLKMCGFAMRKVKFI